MSVLNLPRLHFGGEALWNPNTANNSPGVYDENTLQQNPTIPPDDFVEWLTSLTQNPPPGQSGLNGSWNVYGDGSCWFRDVRISGVQFDYGKPPVGDPISSAEIQIVGGTFDDAARSAGPPPRSRMVDVAPYQSTTTQLFYKWLQLGDAKLGFRAKGACRMFLRWSMLRTFAKLPIAGVAGVIFQTAAAASDIEWFNPASSTALTKLQTAVNASPNQGVVMQFAVYFTLYYKNASYQGKQLADANLLAEAYANGFIGGNPAQSLITGTIGVWGENELASAPTQILLAPANPVGPEATPLPKARAIQEGLAAAAAPTPQPVPLGPAMASVDRCANNLAVTFVSTFLETDRELRKEDLGTVTLQLADGSGSFLSKIADIPYSAYAKESYRRTSGILDFPITAEQVTQIENGTAQIQLIVPQETQSVVALQQTPLVAETDQRGEYLDEGESKTMSVRVYQNGAPVSGIQLTVAQYVEDPTQNNFPYVPVTSFDQAIVDLGTNQFQIVVDVNDGVARFPIRYIKPGTAMLGFFPPGTPVENDDNFPGTTSYYAVIRLLGADNELIELPDDQITWPNTYEDVLQCYNLVYPKMSTIFDLGSESAVVSMARQILAVTDYPQRFDWTLFMPVTREMSKGKRSLLRRFCTKVINKEIPAAPPG